MAKRRPILAVLFLPKREEHLTDAQYEFRRWGHWLMFGSMFAAIYSYGFEQLREALGVGGIFIGVLIGGSCAIGAAKLWRLSIETASEGGKILYRIAWFICMGVVLWGMFTLFNNGLNDSYRALRAAEDRDLARLEQADAMRGDASSFAARLEAANQRLDRAQDRLELALERQATVARVVGSEQSVVCTRNAEIVAIQTAMNIEPIDGCARGITGGAVADDLGIAQDEMNDATTAQEAIFAEQRTNTENIAAGRVAEVEFQANEADAVGGFARFFRGVSLLAYKAQGWIKAERNADQDDLAKVDDRAMTIGAISLLFLSFVLDLLSPVFNSVGSRPAGRPYDDDLGAYAPRPAPRLPPPSHRAAPIEDFVPAGPVGSGSYVSRASVVPENYVSPPPRAASAHFRDTTPPAPSPQADRSILDAEGAIARARSTAARIHGKNRA